MKSERLGFVGVVIENHDSVKAANEILSAFGRMIRGRIGVPDCDNGVSVIGLIVNGSSDQLGAMTGRLGNLPGVQVKSALTAAKPAQKEEN